MTNYFDFLLIDLTKNLCFIAKIPYKIVIKRKLSK
jgi:hypothetical protein